MTARVVDDRVASVACKQCGAFSRTQALGQGASPSLIRRRKASGAWRESAESVFVLRGAPGSWEQALWIACLASTAGPVISHEAAAALHCLVSFRPGPVVVTVPHGDARLAHLAVVHQARNLPEDHTTHIDGLPVTTIARTLVDLAMVVRRARLAYVLDDTVSAGKATYTGLAACLEVAGKRRRGGRLLSALLAQRVGGYTPPASRLEALLLRVLRKGGLPGPVPQHPLPGRERPEGTVDAAYPDSRVLIEADSRRYHTRVHDFAVDRERDIVAQLAGWWVLRFTWDDLTRRPEWVVECVRRALAAGGDPERRNPAA